MAQHDARNVADMHPCRADERRSDDLQDNRTRWIGEARHLRDADGQRVSLTPNRCELPQNRPDLQWADERMNRFILLSFSLRDICARYAAWMLAQRLGARSYATQVA